MHGRMCSSCGVYQYPRYKDGSIPFRSCACVLVAACFSALVGDNNRTTVIARASSMSILPLGDRDGATRARFGVSPNQLEPPYH